MWAKRAPASAQYAPVPSRRRSGYREQDQSEFSLLSGARKTPWLLRCHDAFLSKTSENNSLAMGYGIVTDICSPPSLIGGDDGFPLDNWEVDIPGFLPCLHRNWLSPSDEGEQANCLVYTISELTVPILVTPGKY